MQTLGFRHTLWLLFVLALSSGCSGSGFFGGSATVAPKVPAAQPLIQTDPKDELDDYLRNADHISDAVDAIADQTLADLLREIISLFETMQIDDRVYTVENREVENLVTNAEMLLGLIEDSPLLDLTVEEILENNGGSRDSILDYGYDGYQEDLNDNFETYSDNSDPQEIYDSTLSDTERAASGDTEIKPTKTGKDKDEDDRPTPVAEEEMSPICAANLKSRSKLNASTLGGFAVAVATTTYCQDFAARTGLNPSANQACMDGIVMAGMSTIATASAIVAKFKIDAEYGCSSQE